jgi:hypothetical protein
MTTTCNKNPTGQVNMQYKLSVFKNALDFAIAAPIHDFYTFVSHVTL